MPIVSAGSPPSPAGKALKKLTGNIHKLTVRISRGKAAARNSSVKWQRVFGIGSILLSSLGSVGVIAEKATTDLPGQTGWAFWGSVILLAFGIASQIANQFQVAKHAADSESLAVLCGIYDIRLENMLMEDDPSSAVSTLLVDLNKLFEEKQYNQVLPQLTHRMEVEAATRADKLIIENQVYWELRVRMQRGVTNTQVPPSADVEPPENFAQGQKHEC